MTDSPTSKERLARRVEMAQRLFELADGSNYGTLEELQAELLAWRDDILSGAAPSSETTAPSVLPRLHRLEDALTFYADPETYFAIGFMPDRPCGEFMDDFEETPELGWKPGKRARAALGPMPAEETSGALKSTETGFVRSQEPMAMLPNDYHPSPRCSCRECLRRYPNG